ncbi:MAG: rhomboid family intramembrane serine protease [Proteobacteria bacterium]|nr:rhomboid family intramembrane serine protease [Pseudomonadota bacterium]MBU1686711.1 rhomboid family intramembrane serine protease [Pseudomonadota bacterium]
MFPLKDNIPARIFPAVNIWLILVNCLCFFYEVQLGPGLDGFLFQYGFVPARFVAVQTLDPLGPGRFFPVFSSMFLHGGLLHLLSNMWMLWIFGDNVEDSMGHLRYLVFYLLCGVCSVTAQAMATPASPVPMIGASGAISGVLGAYIFLYPRARILTLIPLFIFFYFIEIPAFVFLGLWLALQLLRGSVSLLGDQVGTHGGVAWWAHVGGFTAGLLLIHFFRFRRKTSGRRRSSLWQKMVSGLLVME